MLNYIDFENPPMTYSIIPHAHCMIYKPSKVLRFEKVDVPMADVGGLDYKQRPRVNYTHLAKVLEAKSKAL